jgi:hypothetical protein
MTIDRGRDERGPSRRIRLTTVVGLLVVVGISVWLVAWLVLSKQCGGSPSALPTQAEELAWLDEAEVVADEFLLSVVDPDELPEWERGDVWNVSAAYVSECSRIESIKLLPGQEAMLWAAIEQAAAGSGYAVVPVFPSEYEADGPTVTYVPEPVWVEIPGGGHSDHVVRLYLHSPQSGSGLEVQIVTACFVELVDGTLPDS